MSLLKILVVSSKYQPEYSGSGLRAHQTYLRLIRKFNYSAEVVCGSVLFRGANFYKLDGVSVTRISHKAFHSSFEYKKTHTLSDKLKSTINFYCDFFPALLSFFVGKRNVDLVHVFGQNAVTSAACVFSRILGKPLVIELVNIVASHPVAHIPAPLRWLIGRTVDKRTTFVCISPKLEELCKEFGYGSYTWTRPNPFDESRYFPDYSSRDRYRSELTRFSATDRLIVNIGAFQPKKNQQLLVQALSLLPFEYKLFLGGPMSESGPNAVRDADHVMRIKEEIRRLGLEDRIEIRIGFIEDTSPYLKAANVYCMPSTTEGFGTPMIESAACAVPVVASRISGVTDAFINEGRNGFLADFTAESLAAAILSACKIPKEILFDGASIVRQSYSSEVIDAQYESVLRATCQRFKNV